jgi:hypothetical protein
MLLESVLKKLPVPASESLVELRHWIATHERAFPISECFDDVEHNVWNEAGNEVAILTAIFAEPPYCEPSSLTLT